MPVNNKTTKSNLSASKEELDKRNKAIAERNALLLAKAKEFAAANPTNPKIPQTLPVAFARSVIGGLADVGGTVLGMVGAGNTKLAKGFNDTAREQQELVNQYYPDIDNPWAAIPAQALARFPQTFSSIAQDVYSPIQKIKAPLALVSKYPQLARIVEEYGPTALNTAYHAIRGGTKEGSKGALVSGSGNLIGEKVIEPAFLKLIESRFPALNYAASAAAGAGNVGGMLYEKTVPGLYEYIQNKLSSK
jgi:hypothetical protein